MLINLLMINYLIPFIIFFNKLEYS